MDVVLPTKHTITMTTNFLVYHCTSSYQAFFQHLEEHFQIGELRVPLVLVMWSAVGKVCRCVCIIESTRSVRWLNTVRDLPTGAFLVSCIPTAEQERKSRSDRGQEASGCVQYERLAHVHAHGWLPDNAVPIVSRWKSQLSLCRTHVVVHCRAHGDMVSVNGWRTNVP